MPDDYDHIVRQRPHQVEIRHRNRQVTVRPIKRGLNPICSGVLDGDHYDRQAVEDKKSFRHNHLNNGGIVDCSIKSTPVVRPLLAIGEYAIDYLPAGIEGLVLTSSKGWRSP